MKKRVTSRFSLLIGAALALSLLTSASASATAFKVRTDPATGVGAYQATLNGAYKPQQESGIYGYEYGPTTAYGQETTPGQIQPEEAWLPYRSTPQKVFNLQPETTYHFRYVVLSFNGELSYGEDKMFTTKSIPRFEAASYYADVTAKQSAEAPVVLSTEGGNLGCAEVGATGRMQAATSSLKMTPSFSGCKFDSFENTVTVALNGCQYVYHPGDSGGPSTTMDVACPEGKAIEVSAGTCGFSIPTQTGLKTIRATNIAATNPDTVSLEFEVSGLTYNKTKDGFGCKFNGTGTLSNASLSGTQTLSAVDSSSAPIDLKIGY